MAIVPAKQQAVKKLLDAAGGLSIQPHIDSGNEVVMWLREHHNIDIAMVDVSQDLRVAHEQLSKVHDQLEGIRDLVEIARSPAV